MTDDAERNELIEALKRIAAESGGNYVPKREFLRRSDASERRILWLFGTYNALAEAAGLETRTFPDRETPLYRDEELLQEIVRVLRVPGSRMTRIFFEQHANASSSVCERRFGGWIAALRRASELLDPGVDVELLTRLREYTEARVLPASPQVGTSHGGPVADDGDEAGLEAAAASAAVRASVPLEASPNVFGDFINFRGLQHAPVNEQGVVFLFGMVCRELGYVVESVRAAFPDCEAKRRVRDSPPRWQRVRVEFEYLSRSFRAHGHDPDQCDVIVCWQDNWPECPVEVLELQKELSGLPIG